MHKLKVGVSASVILCVAALPLTAQAPNFCHCLYLGAAPQ
jgi:hypothetical protein